MFPAATLRPKYVVLMSMLVNDIASKSLQRHSNVKCWLDNFIYASHFTSKLVYGYTKNTNVLFVDTFLTC